jgi:hypothetical protein
MAITQHNLKADLRMAHMLSQEIRLLLADSTSLRNTPYMSLVGSINGLGSDTIRVRKAGLDGYDGDQWSTFSGAQEPDAVADTALTDASADVVVKRRALAYAISDMASMDGLGSGDLNPFRIAESISKSYDGMFADLTADAMAGFTNIQGGTGQVLTVTRFVTGIARLENVSGKNVPGPYVCVLHPKNWAELQDSIRAETGAVMYNPATYDTISAKGSNYKGSFLGVEIYTSSYVTNDGVDNLAAMWAPGGIGFAVGAPQIVGAAQVMDMDQVTIEFSRDATKALTRVIGHAYLGLSVIDDDRGCIIKSAV